MNGCHEYVGVMAARDEGFAELTVAARDEGDVAEAGGFVQLAVAARGKRGVGEGRRGTTDGGSLRRAMGGWRSLGVQNQPDSGFDPQVK